MPSREVIDNLLRKRPTERVGCFDKPWPDTLREWVKQGMPTRIPPLGRDRAASFTRPRASGPRYLSA